MVSDKTPEELPPGWKESVKVKNGRRTKYFINLATGQKLYSKKSVIRFVNSLENSPGSSPSTAKPDNGSMPSENEATPDNVGTNESTEWLPHGWTVESRPRRSCSASASVYKIYTDPSSGSKFYSKPQVMRYLQELENKNARGKQQLQISEETHLERQNTSQSVEGKITSPGEDKNQNTSQSSESLEGKNHIPGENENSNLKIAYSDVQEKMRLDELPPGWIKETKTRKCGSKMRSDPYYVDTATGYAFRSKKDVMRYLATGDINCCAIRPQKWDPSTSHDENNSAELVTRNLFIGEKSENGKESSQTSTRVVAEAENSNDKDKEDAAPALATKLTASTIEEPHLGSGITECDKSVENSGLEAEGSKQDVEVVHGNMAVDGTDADGFHEQKVTENCSDKKTKADMRTSEKRKPPSTPARLSKRLAGHGPEMLPNFNLTERTLRAAIRKPHDIGADRALSKAIDTAADEVLPQHPVTQVETTIPSNSTLNTAADDVSQQPATEAEIRLSNLEMDMLVNEMSVQPIVTETDTMVAHHISSAEPSLGNDLQNNFEVPSENPVEQQTTGLVNERLVEENPMTQGDYWSDPCWDFAFKTLTGAIPLEDTLTLPGCFLQPTGTSSYTQDNATFGLTEFDIPPIFQDNVPQVDPVQNDAPADQITDPTLATPGNISLSVSQPSLEAQSKEYETKVKS